MGDQIFSFHRNVIMKTFPCFIAVAIFMVNFSGIFARPKYVPFKPQAEKEHGDVKEVTGQYSYIDPTGALVTVTYTAGPNGYTEDRIVQEGFFSIGLRASKEPSNPELNPNDEEKTIEKRARTSMNIQRLKNDLKIPLECQALKKVDRSLTDGPRFEAKKRKILSVKNVGELTDEKIELYTNRMKETILKERTKATSQAAGNNKIDVNTTLTCLNESNPLYPC